MTTTTHHPTRDTEASTHETRERNLALRIGTFADGQRTVPLDVTYSANVGSFADAQQG
jgi:hypothetical protein